MTQTGLALQELSSLGRPTIILLVEDNRGDVRLIREALKEGRIFNTLHVVGDGEEALGFLQRQGQYRDAPIPDLILLDLNLPRKNGQEVLEEIKQDKRLRTIPVVVLTTSNEERDVLASYRLHANCYVTKPLDFQQFVEVVKSIEDFWFSLVRLPKGSDS